MNLNHIKRVCSVYFSPLRKCKTGGFDYGTVRRGTVTSASGRDGLYAAGTSAGRIYIFFPVIWSFSEHRFMRDVCQIRSCLIFVTVLQEMARMLYQSLYSVIGILMMRWWSLACIWNRTVFRQQQELRWCHGHSFSKVIAPDRPNEQDQTDWKEFVAKVLRKLEQEPNCAGKISDLVSGTNPPEKYYTPLGIDGQPAKFLKAHPKTDPALCKKCGICAANCPMGTIQREDPSVIEGVCIKCQSCIRKCPAQAKYFDDPAFLSHKQMLEHNFIRPATSVFIS